MASPADPAKRAEVKVTDEMILKMVPDRSHKVQAPEILKPTNRFATREDTIKAFEDARKATMDFVRTTNDDLRTTSARTRFWDRWMRISGFC